MKKIINIFILFAGISAFSQSPIYNNPNYGDEQEAYYKDINNIHDQYEGTWLYTNGNTSLKITFVKKNHEILSRQFFRLLF